MITPTNQSLKIGTTLATVTSICKNRLAIVISSCFLVAICLLAGCRLRTGAGTIYYEAKTPTAVTALRSRIEPLRTALQANTNFTEITNREVLMFRGTTNGQFVDCFVSFNRDERDLEKACRAGCCHRAHVQDFETGSSIASHRGGTTGHKCDAAVNGQFR
ncbi:MAG TPA: hypothetical protein VMZ27_16935 [Candidatus Saccharimonadales bacterium]|nr:hypothetical protein [Candidatus Saccharimonadales bacterium]